MTAPLLLAIGSLLALRYGFVLATPYTMAADRYPVTSAVYLIVTASLAGLVGSLFGPPGPLVIYIAYLLGFALMLAVDIRTSE